MSTTQGRKWDVGDGFVMPKVEDIVPNGEVARASTELDSSYYDTVDLDLAGAGVTVRRRNEASDVSWLVNAPGFGGAIEVRAAPSEAVPNSITRLLHGLAGGKDLVDVATIHTTRDSYRVTRADDDELCALLADDRVWASTGDRLAVWREVDVEIGPGIDAIPARLVRRLEAAGALPSSESSKLGHVLPGRQQRAVDARRHPLAAYTRTQLDAIIAGDIALRRGEDPIHDTRVAIRRLRSTIRVFRRALSISEETRGVEDDLRWFAGLLGEVRDCQVQIGRLTRALNDLPADLILGPVRGDVTSHLLGSELPARQRVADAMDSDRYLQMIAVLRQWRNDPPVAEDRGARTLNACARRARKKADRRLARAADRRDDAVLHRARKAAKRARYAAEALAPADPKSRRKAKRYKRIQSILGDHQDTVVARELLRRMAAAGAQQGRNGFTYGVLFERERGLAKAFRRQVSKLTAR